MKKTIITIILSATSVIIFLFVKNSDLKNKNKLFFLEDHKTLLRVLDRINEVWKYAKVTEDLICRPYGNVSNHYYQCNEEYFTCLLKEKKINILLKKKRTLIESILKPIYRVGPISKGYEYQLKIKNKRLDVFLEDSCSEVYLPQRIYKTFVLNRDLSVEWDNFNKDIFVDKYLIRVKDIKYWAVRNGLENKIIKREAFEIVDNFLVSEMNDYCISEGKRVMSSQVWDAMSIYPENMANNLAKNIRLPYYPWTRKNSETDLFLLQKKTLERVDEKSIKYLCEKVFAAECLNIKDSIMYKNTNTVTWMGSFETLGGVMEYTDNVINPNENLKLSSFYFPFSSKVHRVGVRGYWDGKGFYRPNFRFKNFNQKNKDEEFKVGFRCMRLR